MKRIAWYLTLTCLTCSMLAVSPAFAANADFDAAMRFFEAIEFRQAEPLFEKALASASLTATETVHARECLAEIYVATGRREKAVAQYGLLLQTDRSYRLTKSASPSLRAAYKEARAQLPPKVVEKKPVENSPTPKKTVEPSKNRRTLGWTLVGVGAGLVAAGSTSYFLAMEKNDDLGKATNEDEADSDRETGQLFEYVGYSSAAAGLASSGLGVFFLVSSHRGHQPKSEATWFAAYYPSPNIHRFSLGVQF